MRLTLIILLLSSTTIFAQEGFKFTDPESASQHPIELTPAQAIDESNQVKSSCGFSGAYVSKNDLDHLMNLNKCVGIRIYNGKADSKQQYCGVIVVAIDENGKEIGHFMANKYLDIGAEDGGNSSTAEKINQTNAKDRIINVANSESLDYQKVFFSKSTVNERLAVDGATGLHIKPGEVGGHKTMMIASATLDRGSVNALDGKYLKSRLPCPVQCGDTGNYLVQPK